MASNHVRFSQILTERSIVALSGDGDEQLDFLQSLVTNDVSRAAPDTLVYAALLTPQGKYLSDFLVWRTDAGDFRLDVATSLSADLVKRLTMYRLRRPIAIDHEQRDVTAVWGSDPGIGLHDPRHPDLGWRIYDGTSIEAAPGDYDLHRLALGVPESAIDLVVNDTYVLEAGFERMAGVDFRKGCYVGQEIVARMKHKTELRKGLVPVRLSGNAPVGTVLMSDDGKPAGTLYSNRDGVGIAHLRFDRAKNPLTDAENKIKINAIEDNNDTA